MAESESTKGLSICAAFLTCPIWAYTLEKFLLEPRGMDSPTFR